MNKYAYKKVRRLFEVFLGKKRFKKNVNIASYHEFIESSKSSQSMECKIREISGFHNI